MTLTPSPAPVFKLLGWLSTFTPAGGGSLVRDVASWRTYVTYHAKTVSSSVNGVAAQAIAVSHALNTAALRNGLGFNGASAAQVSDSVRALFGTNGTGLWAEHAPNTVALLDPITGLAVRLVHVHCDGFIALMPEDASDVVVPGEHAPSTSPAPLETVLGAAPALPNVSAVPGDPPQESAPASAVVPRTRVQGIQQPLGRLFKAWVRALPGDTSLSFGANSKTGKIAARLAA